MCGFVGEFNFNETKINENILRGMRDCLRHRGPDDSGIYCDKSIGLGFRRLSILDLTPTGHQPMSNEDGTIWIVFNGEIYNFQELRPSLEKKGHKFKSYTDTETIIHLYEEEGEQCIQKLRGMFAFAIWDSRREQLFIARDRIGKKPLKYYHDDAGIIFASELKALLRHPRVPRDMDPEAIHHYLTLQYVPAPLTGFRKIKKLKPGYFLLIRKNHIEEKEYWRLNYSSKTVKSEEEWKYDIIQKFEESVKLRLISDVPLGAFLSGGIDSSAVVAMMAKHSSGPVKTFSIGFNEATHNEMPYARTIAKQFGTDHTEFIVEPKAVDILPKIVYHYEEPYADSSALPTYYLSEMTRQNVTVALNGDGGDENFAGYERYPIFLFAEWMRRNVPSPVLKAIELMSGFTARIYPTTLTDRAHRFASSLEYSAARRYLEYMQYFSDELKATIYHSEFLSRKQKRKTSDLITEKFNESQTKDSLDQLLYTDITTYLPDDLLVKVDIASMAVSLEARSPLLDHQLMELTASIPPSLKIRGYQKKYIFRQALRGIIPDEILDRKKMGFGVPIEHWFRGSLNNYIREHLLDGRFARRNIIRNDFVSDLIEKHIKGKVNYAYQLWALLMLELWFEEFFDN